MLLESLRSARGTLLDENAAQEPDASDHRKLPAAGPPDSRRIEDSQRIEDLKRRWFPPERCNPYRLSSSFRLVFVPLK